MTDPTTIVRQGLERVELEPLTPITFHARRGGGGGTSGSPPAPSAA